MRPAGLKLAASGTAEILGWYGRLKVREMAKALRRYYLNGYVMRRGTYFTLSVASRRNETINDASVLQAAWKAYRDNGGSMKALLTSDAFLYLKLK